MDSVAVLNLPLSVRALADYVARTGGLTAGQMGGLAPRQGTRLHQQFYHSLQQLNPEATIQTELSVEGFFPLPPLTGLDTLSLQIPSAAQTDPDKPLEPRRYTLWLRGRIDAVISSASGESTLLEAKSYAGLPTKVPAEGLPLHWAQALIYTVLFHQAQPEGKRQFRYGLVYLSVEGYDPLYRFKEISEAKAYEQVKAWIEAYAQWAQQQAFYRQIRDASIRQLTFPYPHLRLGQKKLMRTVLQACQQQVPLIAQAPTGTGKTLSTLYPALKSLASHGGKQIFYLTAKVATRQVAEQSLSLLYQTGLIARSITLRAKEQLCCCPSCYCDTNLCPYALGYYDRLRPALNELLKRAHIDPDALLSVAQTHQLCPFELSLDAADSADIILGDYAHFFDPRARLSRFFGPDESRRILLFDEAHNLPDRTREMYSATLSLKTLVQALEAVRQYSPNLADKLEVLRQYYARLAKSLKTGEPGFDQVEKAIEPSAVFSAPQFRATRIPLPGLRRFLFSLLSPLQALIEALESVELRQKLRGFYFEVSFFIRVLDEFWNASYLACFERTASDIVLQLRCLDPTHHLVERYRDRHTPIFFSATLHPTQYYRSLLCGENLSDQPMCLDLGSPFPREHQLVLHYADLETTYDKRPYTYQKVIEIIQTATQARVGNYLIFFPSYAYLQAVYSRYPREAGLNAPRLIRQEPGFSPQAQAEFLKAFETPAQTRSLLGFAVLGGSFSEGIDLVGERLKGAIIIGVGLPLVSPPRELLQQYYEEKLQSGFAFAYLFPGMTKVQQAAGRVIRSEGDRGFILLCDRRYEQPSYRELLPDDWQWQRIDHLDELADTLETFWSIDD